MNGPDLSYGLEELAGLISFYVGGWHDFGYEIPPTPECHVIPPLGERSAKNIRDAHAAIEAIDQLIRQLNGLRSQLASELRQNEDILMARLDAKYGPLLPELHRLATAVGSPEHWNAE